MIINREENHNNNNKSDAKANEEEARENRITEAAGVAVC